MRYAVELAQQLLATENLPRRAKAKLEAKLEQALPVLSAVEAACCLLPRSYETYGSAHFQEDNHVARELQHATRKSALLGGPAQAALLRSLLNTTATRRP
jgi:hypothetical protein